LYAYHRHVLEDTDSDLLLGATCMHYSFSLQSEMNLMDENLFNAVPHNEILSFV